MLLPLEVYRFRRREIDKSHMKILEKKFIEAMSRTGRAAGRSHELNEATRSTGLSAQEDMPARSNHDSPALQGPRLSARHMQDGVRFVRIVFQRLDRVGRWKDKQHDLAA